MALVDVLPTTWSNLDGRAHIGGVHLGAIADRYGTPAYVFDVAHLKERMASFTSALEGVGRPVYATKAFLCTALVELLASTNWLADVVSLGEAATVHRGGIPSERIMLHGSLKTDPELALAVRGEVGIIVIDSLYELDRIEGMAGEAGAIVDVMIRLNEDLDLTTNPKVLTTGDEAKFGLLEDEAAEAVNRIAETASLRMRGVHVHVGSLATDPGLYAGIVERLVDFVVRHRSAFPVSPVLLDAGGGIATPYLRDDLVIEPAEVGAAMREALEEFDAPGRIGPVELLLEPGRSLVANAGVILYTIGVRKPLPVGGELLGLDGGMTDNPRPALYGSRYELLVVDRLNDPADSTFRVFGRLCESDVMLDEVAMPSSMAPGDVVVMPAAGAYTYSMSSRYNGLLRPPVLFVEDGTVREVVRRETIDDVLAGEFRLDDALAWSYTPAHDDHR